MQKLYVGNLPGSITEEQVREMFSGHGNITKVILVKDRKTGQVKEFCFIECKNKDEAKKALELNGKEFEGKILKVEAAEPKK